VPQDLQGAAGGDGCETHGPEPCHLLRCWDLNFAGRSVERIDARLLMAYSSTLLSSILLLHYDEFVILSYVLLLCMIALPFAISRFLTTPPFFALAVRRGEASTACVYGVSACLGVCSCCQSMEHMGHSTNGVKVSINGQTKNSLQRRVYVCQLWLQNH